MSNSSQGPLLIVGASVRAAAFSALAAGYSPHGLDLFADLDLARRCPATAVADYPQGFLAAARQVPAMPWMYVGGLENHPCLVDAMAQERELLGNAGEALRKARDPWAVKTAIEAADCRWPECRSTGRELPRDGSWLRKGHGSAGGAAVRRWDDSLTALGGEAGFYYQRQVAGESFSAAYLGDGSTAALLGITRQLVGSKWAGCEGFRYCGSIGPVDVPQVVEERLRELGRRLTAWSGMKGLFGVDYVLENDDIWPVDVNPRLTASVEILERAGGWSAAGWQVSVCRGRTAPPITTSRAETKHGKVIAFAKRDSIVPAALSERLLSMADASPLPLVADVPAMGTPLLTGRPICTFFAQGRNEREVIRGLQAAMQTVLQH